MGRRWRTIRINDDTWCFCTPNERRTPTWWIRWTWWPWWFRKRWWRVWRRSSQVLIYFLVLYLLEKKNRIKSCIPNKKKKKKKKKKKFFSRKKKKKKKKKKK